MKGNKAKAKAARRGRGRAAKANSSDDFLDNSDDSRRGARGKKGGKVDASVRIGVPITGDWDERCFVCKR